MRNTFNVVRYDWLGVRIGGPGASMRGLWPVLILALLVVFGCFFAIGRLFAGGGSPLEGSSAAPVQRAAIPRGLAGGSPIAGEVPSSIAEPPVQRRTTPARGAEVLRATAPSQVFSGETATTEASTRLESAPAEAPEPSRTSSGTGSAAGKPSAARATGGAGSGSGGSFDTSE